MDTGAAEGDGGSGSGSGNLRIRDNSRLLSARTTRADLEKLINSSIRPLYIKQEILDGEETVVEAMDEDDDDIVLDTVVTGAAADQRLFGERGGGKGRGDGGEAGRPDCGRAESL